MLRQAVCAALLAMATAASAAGFADKSTLGTPDYALCTAAAMKSGQGFALYKSWVEPLNARYKVIYPNLSDKERDAYTAERVLDKRAALNRKGIATTPAFKAFYDTNCKPYGP